MFEADPSPHSEITSNATDLETPLGIMDDDGNILTNPTHMARAVRLSTQGAFLAERIINAGRIENCVTDVRELVGALLLS